VGSVSGINLEPEQESRTLTVEVREAGGLGRQLCEPLQVLVRVLQPEQYIRVVPFFRGGTSPEVGLLVNHLDTARAPFPAQVTVAVEPFSAVRQRAAPLWIERGETARYSYQVVDPRVEVLRFSITIDGVPDAIVREYTIQGLKAGPPAVPSESPP
jgi:hypothetical protein